MHRVLSFQMPRGDNQVNEAISKRLCCSFLFTTAFLSIVGGFLLGRYVTERNLFIKGTQPCNSKEKRTDLLDTLDKLSNATKIFRTTIDEAMPQIFEYSPVSHKLQSILLCPTISPTDTDISHINIKEQANTMLSLHVHSLTICLNEASKYIKEQELLGYNSSSG